MRPVASAQLGQRAGYRSYSRMLANTRLPPRTASPMLTNDAIDRLNEHPALQKLAIARWRRENGTCPTPLPPAGGVQGRFEAFAYNPAEIDDENVTVKVSGFSFCRINATHLGAPQALTKARAFNPHLPRHTTSRISPV